MLKAEVEEVRPLVSEANRITTYLRPTEGLWLELEVCGTFEDLFKNIAPSTTSMPTLTKCILIILKVYKGFISLMFSLYTLRLYYTLRLA